MITKGRSNCQQIAQTKKCLQRHCRKHSYSCTLKVDTSNGLEKPCTVPTSTGKKRHPGLSRILLKALCLHPLAAGCCRIWPPTSGVYCYWIQTLFFQFQPYDLTTELKPGKYLVVADTLSRAFNRMVWEHDEKFGTTHAHLTKKSCLVSEDIEEFAAALTQNIML